MFDDLSVDDLKRFWTCIQLYREGFDRGRYTSRVGREEMLWGRRMQEHIDTLLDEKEPQEPGEESPANPA